ncbi:Integrin-linked protein kinase pat-4-like [Homarus americanus]|uniref:Integrin-linked protein kinase pat-4-like n=1 Tax=Homarus americanus TaxID=6706 RepID=A0A8J5MKK5_HOMAM|nr:Integrin-linked protein kinase pat-4-like [Homarus americanus]
MDDIFHWCREGNTVQVRLWLDDTEHDMNQGPGISSSITTDQVFHRQSPQTRYFIVNHHRPGISSSITTDQHCLILPSMLRVEWRLTQQMGQYTHSHKAALRPVGTTDSHQIDAVNNLHPSDDHGFSLLHWAAKEGHVGIVEMLVTRGARINSTNLGDDIPLHLAAAHGHRDVTSLLLRHKADVNFINEHGNTPLHYACFWAYSLIAEDLVQAGASVSIANKYGEVPLDKCRGVMAKKLHTMAVDSGQNLEKVAFKDQSWLGFKTRSRDATLSRHKGININELALHTKIAVSPSGELWRGKWQGNEIIAKILALRECSARICRDFNEEFPRLSPPNLVVITQYLPNGSLFTLLHQDSGIVVDTAQALKFALDIARGMAFIHSLEKLIPNLYVSSKHIMIDDDLTARVSMADAKFSFQERGKLYSPQWFSPEALQKKPKELNIKAADMWSFAVTLWEMATREVPFADLTPMEAGMKIALEGLRVSVPPGISPHISKLVRICMNEDPGKRPSFDMILPILEKMCTQ